MTKVINHSKPGSCAKHLSSNRIQEILMILPMTIGFLLFSVYPIIWVIRWHASIITASARPSGVGWTTSSACSHGILPTGILC